MVGTNSTVPESTNYIKSLHDQFVHHRIYEKIQQISLKSKQQLDEEMTTTLMQEINKLDENIAEAMLRAETRNCSKKDPTMYSPILKQSNLEIQYWNILHKAIRQNIFPIVRLINIADQMEMSTLDNIKNNTVSVTKALKNSLKRHNLLVKEVLIHRKQYLQQKLEDEQKKSEKKRKKTTNFNT